MGQAEGLSEVIKHYFITKNLKLQEVVLSLIKDIENKNVLIDGIILSYEIKSSFVSEDIYDLTGSHKALSYGHTFANAIERLYPNIRHSEAVLNGMYFAGILAFSLGILEEEVYSNHQSILQNVIRIMPNIVSITKENFPSFIESFKTDKISDNGKMNFLLLDNFGSFLAVTATESQLKKAFGVL